MNDAKPTEGTCQQCDQLVRLDVWGWTVKHASTEPGRGSWACKGWGKFPKEMR